MYLQHFGLHHPPLGKETTELWDDGALAPLRERFAWLLHSPGIGLITGEPGVGKTAALRQLTGGLNPHRYQVIYQAETDFGRLDIYRGLARALGVEPGYRRAQLWRDLKERILELVDGRQVTPVWIIDEAQNLPPEFFRDLPAFLNFAFDARDVLAVWLVGHPVLAQTLERAPYAALHSRLQVLSYQGQHIQHMQKALSQMNIQLGNVISDVVGETGQRILRAIIAGERDPQKLAELKHGRIQASKEQIAMALHGNWREEHLFALTQAVELFDAYSQALQRCDIRLESMLGALSRTKDEPGPTKRRRISKVKNAPKFDVRTYLFRICGVDLTAIDGIDTTTALKVIAEVGPDLSRFKSAKHFASWLGLCPGTKISGGKLLSGATKRTANRVAQALKMAAISLRASQSALGAYFRRMCARLDKGKAVTAVAHKLARLIYAMLTKGAAYVDQGQEYYEERYRQRVLFHLKRKAAALGLELVPVQSQQT